MATATLTINVGFRWWVRPLMSALIVLAHCGRRVNAEHWASLIAKRGTVLKLR